MKENKLTQRETQVLFGIADGFTTKEIADRLYISIHTVISHRKTLMRKLKVENAPSMIRKGFELGVLRIPSN